MNQQFILPLTHPSIGRSLEQNLLTSIVPLLNTPFYYIQLPTGISYQYPIAIQLAKGNLQQAKSINNKILSNLNNLSIDLLHNSEFLVEKGNREHLTGNRIEENLNFVRELINEHFSLKITVKSHLSGLLEFFLDYQEINRWLQELPKLFLNNYSFSLSNSQQEEMTDEIFELQYAHARCCSLLRLGHLERLIQLNTLNFDRSFWFWSLPAPIPFSEITWKQAEERELIEQIIKIVDSLDSVNSISALKLGLNLSRAFLKFERYCRIWGEVKRQSITLAQARLGMIVIVQLLLQFLLTEKLGLTPLMEL